LNGLNHLNADPFFAGAKPRLIGHRGAAGEAPENTLASFERALADAAEFVELDVRASSDGDVVVIHDSTVERTTDGHGRVKQLTLAELKTLNAGYRFTTDGGATHPYRGRAIKIPTLKELFETFPQIRAIIELKQAHPSIVSGVIDVVCRAGKERQALLVSEDNDIMAELREELQRRKLAIATGFCHGEVEAFMEWLAEGRSDVYRPPGQSMQLPVEYAGMTLVNAQTLAAARAIGVEMFVWTVDDPAEMKRLLELGVDGIITNHPARLRALLGR
jgi:glycerophosphoryl diester phosphodiesterase